jgi:type IX secretion system PorP/SprF family membrane protein
VEKHVQGIRRFGIWLLVAGLVPAFSPAQDLHFSQYFNAPLLINPANTGFIPDANYRFGVNYRDQWTNIPVPYQTMSAYGDVQLLRNVLTYGWLGVGGSVIQDDAGSGDLVSTTVYGSIAYHQLLGQSSLVSAGFNAGWSQKRIDLSKLTFGDQWNGKFFDAALPTDEPITQTSVSYLDLQAGLNYAYFPSDNLYFNAGFSVQHVNEPRETFYADNNVIPRRYIAFLNVSIKVSDLVILNPSGYYSNQAKASEMMLGGYVSYNLSGDGDRQLLGGVYYRVGDAAVPMVGYQLSNIRMMFSYDATVSTLGNFNQHVGAYELSVIYLGVYSNSTAFGDRKDFKCPSF